MPDIQNLQAIGTISTEQRAIRAWNRIQRSPSTVNVLRKGDEPSEQTVRIELSNGGTNTSLPAAGMVGNQDIVIYGVKNHPSEDVTDTDIQRLDRVIVNSKEYTIENVVYPPGEIQAFGVARK